MFGRLNSRDRAAQSAKQAVVPLPRTTLMFLFDLGPIVDTLQLGIATLQLLAQPDSRTPCVHECVCTACGAGVLTGMWMPTWCAHFRLPVSPWQGSAACLCRSTCIFTHRRPRGPHPRQPHGVPTRTVRRRCLHLCVTPGGASQPHIT